MLTEAVRKPQRAASHCEQAVPPQVIGASLPLSNVGHPSGIPLNPHKGKWTEITE